MVFIIANFLINRDLSEILDAEAENLTHEQTAQYLIRKKKKAVFMVYGQQPSASTQCIFGKKLVFQ